MSPALQAAWDNCRRRLAARGVRIEPAPALQRPAVHAPEPSHVGSTTPIRHHLLHLRPPTYSGKDAAAGERPQNYSHQE